MTEQYVNMRLKVPHFIHAQLRMKQAERRKHGIAPMNLSDIVVMMLADAFILEHWQHPKIEEKEKNT